MAIQEITYTDKISLVTSPLPDENKVTDNDMNMIKNVVNNNITISGSNTNGTYIKFANGIMICTKTVTLTNVDVNSGRGSIYVSNALSLGNFAESFNSTPVVCLNLEASSARGWIDWHNSKSSTSAGVIYLARAVSDTGLTFNVDVIAIGTYE